MTRTRRRKAKNRSPRMVLFRQITLGVGVIALVSLFGVGVWYGTRIDSLTIQSVDVSGGETIAPDDIRAIVESHLSGSYFTLIPHRFAWTYPEQAIRADIAATARVHNVELTRPSGTELAVAFSEYEPAGLWCSKTYGTQCVFVDKHGYAFAEAPALSGSALLRYVDAAREPAIGQSAYATEASKRFHEVRKVFSDAYDLMVVSIEQIAPEEISYHLAGGGEIKVSQSMPLEAILANLATIFASSEFAHLTSGQFAYIDMRYGDKVFVNENIGSPEAVADVLEELSESNVPEQSE